MATTMEQRAKFRELRLTGTSREDAMKQAYGSVAPTPPTPTGGATIPTQNFPSQPINQQTTTGVNGETFKVAPVNAQGVTPQAPQSVAPIQPVAPNTPPTTQNITPTPTTTPVDKTAEIKAQNEAQMALNKQKSDLAIQERKKAAEDAKLAATPTDQGSILTSLISGVSVPQQNTAAYRNAQFQYKNYQKFNSMTPQQLLDNMKMGEIDTATSQLLANNPSYIKAKQDFDKFQKNQSINQMIKSVASGVTGKTETVDYSQQASDSLARKLGIDETNADAYATIVSKNPEVVELTKSVSSLTKQLNILVDERNTIYKELKQQYPDLSASAIMTLMASRTQKWSSDIDALNSSLSLKQADLKTAMELAKGEYEATKEDIALQAGIAKENRAMQNSLALSQMEFDQKIAQQAQAMGTPELAIPEVINQYAQLGIMAQKSAQQHIADAKAFIARGGTLGQYISQMQKDFQAKPEYKAKFAPESKPTATWTKIGVNADGSDKYGFVDIATSTVTPYDVTPSTYLDVPRTGNNVGQDTNNPGNIMGDTEAQRNLAIQYGAVGFYKSPNGRTYAVFPDMQTGVNASMTDLQSKLTGGSSWATPNTTLEKFASGWVSGPNAPINQNAVDNYVKLTGYPKNTPISQIPMDTLAKAVFANEGVDISKSASITSSQPTSQYNDQNIADLAYLVELQDKNPTQAAKEMKELGYTSRDLANYKGGNVPLTDRQKQSSVNLANSIKDLLTNYDYTDATGMHFFDEAPRGSDWASAEEKIKTIVANMTLPNLGMLKGPMSDKDLAFIQAASSNLSTNQSDKAFANQLLQAYNLAARRAGLPEVKNLDEIKNGGLTQPDTGAGQVNYVSPTGKTYSF